MCENRKKVSFNGEAISQPAALDHLRPMLRRSSVVAGGGMLWKAALWSDGLAIHIGPHFIEGQRAYHYDMALPADAGPVLTGSIRPDGRVSLLFDAPAADEDPTVLRRTCEAVAGLLIDAGLPRRCRLDEISRAGLAEVGAFAEPPMTVGELAAEGKGPARP